MGREGEELEALLPDFARRYPRTRIAIQQVPWSAAHERLMTAFAADVLPDVGQLGNTWVAEFAALGALAPLDPYLAASKTVKAADFFDGIWRTNVVDGRVLGVPWYVDTRLLFYRRDLFEAAGVAEPPRTWDAWRQALAALKRSAGGQRYPILLPVAEPEPLLALALQQHADLLRDGGRYGDFDAPPFRRALDFYLSMFADGLAPVADGQFASLAASFEAGEFASFVSGPWNIGELSRRLRGKPPVDWMTAPLPGPSGPGESTAGGASLVLFASAGARSPAWQLVEYLSEPEVQARFHRLTGDLPARRDAWQDPALVDDPYARAFRDQLERVVPAPRLPEWERVVAEMQRTVERIVRKRIDVDGGLEELDRRVDALLEKRRWMLARAGR